MQEFKIDNFDTFILDLDSTVWLGIEPTFWAKKLKFQIKKERQRVYYKDNKLIVEVYKNAIKKNLDKKKSAKNLTKRLSTILKKYLE